MKQAPCGSDPTPGHVEQWPGSTPALVAAGPACVIQSSFLHEALSFLQLVGPHQQRAAALLAQSTRHLHAPQASPLPKGLLTPWLHSPALHSYPNGQKRLLSLLGESRETPASWAFSALAHSQRAMAGSPAMLSASEFLEGVTDPAPPNHCTRQPNQQHPPSCWKARGAAGSLLP